MTLANSASTEEQTIGGQIQDEQSSGSSILEERLENLEPGDHERYSHYVRKEKIVESAVMGTPVVALCGKTWVPGRDPDKFPVCPTCKDIYDGLRPEDPKSSGKGDKE
jgi:hypothetical protein